MDIKTLNSIVCEKIKQIRMENGLTQLDVSTKLNIERTTYSKIESGKTELTLNIVEKIATIFEVEVANILCIENHKTIHVKADKILLSANGTNSILNLSITNEDLNSLIEN